MNRILTTSLLCIFDICWVSTAVALVKNDVLFLVLIGKVLEYGFLSYYREKHFYLQIFLELNISDFGLFFM